MSSKYLGLYNWANGIAICKNMKSKDEVHEFCGVGCTKCEACVKACPTGALRIENDIIKFDKSLCTNCTKCVNVCPNSTITNINSDLLNF